ncbi:MAG: hypothetical protein HXX17_02395 [Geobacteraceae bacterium]|nr:hypothetical protein [Geobacteraceae bacterium]
MTKCITIATAVLFLASQVFAADAPYSFEDQHIRIEGEVKSAAGKKSATLELKMTPKEGWKLLADNSSGTKPLRLTVGGARCIKASGVASFSKPDISGYDESGAYSEYYTKTATAKQEFTRQGCGKNDSEPVAKLTYLLCQESRCVGPFSRELKAKGK